MKNLISVLGWTFGILVIVFAFLLYWQKEQHAHDERVMNSYMASDNLKKAQTIEVEEVKSLKEKVWSGMKAFGSFCLNMLTK